MFEMVRCHCRIFRKSILVSLLLLLLLPCQARVKNDRPLVWDMSQLDKMRKEGGTSKAAKKILAEADELCGQAPLAVTDKKKLTFEPEKHYFCSIGRYWWPDSLNPGKYVNRDGEVNPAIKDYDNERLSTMVSRCKTLSKAFYISGEKKYYDAFILQLRVWFLDKETYMYPTFEYSQVVPGQNGNKGRSTGLISAYEFNTLIESIRLVNGEKKINRRTMKGMQKWFLAFAEDSESRYGKQFRDEKNNISLAFDVTMANMYLFAGKEKKAKTIVDEFASLRIERQIMEDGRQPEELKRTKAYTYSVFNLTHIVDMCYLARYWYPNYYLTHSERIDKAFQYLGQYVENAENFPYQQITSWDKCWKDYKKQSERIKQLQR